jgi:hypothetical protein
VPRSSLLPLVLLALLTTSIACAPGITRGLPRGDWDVVATATAAGAQLRYLTLVGVEPVEAPAAAVARLARFLDEVGPAWRVPDRIDYYAFPDRATLHELTGWDTHGRALLEHDATVSIHAADAHEVAHLLTVPPARPLRLASLWVEGIAMYYTWPEIYFDPATLAERGLPPRLGAWYGLTVHGNAQRTRAAGELPALRPLVHGNVAFRALPDGVTYPAAGSFVTYLLGAGHGDPDRIAAFRAFLAEANAASHADEVEQAFARHLGLSLGEAEAGWHALLDGWDEAAAP